MRIMSRNLDYYRLELHIDSQSLTIKRLRRKVGGGWYVKDLEWFPWPWNKVS